MFGDFARALAQLPDRRFRAVLWRGVGLTALLLLVFYALFGIVLHTYLPEVATLPFFGEVGFVDDVLTGVALLSILFLSTFLMVPVAAMFTGIFLEQIADAVESKHYAHLGPAPGLRMRDAIKESVNFTGLVIALNVLGTFLYVATGPVAPLIYFALNGYLLGREYFTLVAARHLGLDGARAMRKKHRVDILVSGVLMALPLTVPIMNLFIPILGVASYTHKFHRLAAKSR